MLWLSVLSQPLIALAWAGLWYGLWTRSDWRRRRAYATHIADWPDAVLEASLIHYLTIVADYRAASFPKPSMRNADNALIMATLLQERLDLTSGRAPQRYLRRRRTLLRRACGMAKTSTPR